MIEEAVRTGFAGAPVVTAMEAVSPIRRPASPAINAPSSGANTRRVTMICGVIAA